MIFLEHISKLAGIILGLNSNENCVVTHTESKIHFDIKLSGPYSEARSQVSILHIILRLPGYEQYITPNASTPDFDSMMKTIRSQFSSSLEFETMADLKTTLTLLLNYELETVILAGQQRDYDLYHQSIEDYSYSQHLLHLTLNVPSDNTQRLHVLNRRDNKSVPYSIETTLLDNNFIQIKVNLPGSVAKVKQYLQNNLALNSDVFDVQGNLILLKTDISFLIQRMSEQHFPSSIDICMVDDAGSILLDNHSTQSDELPYYSVPSSRNMKPYDCRSSAVDNLSSFVIENPTSFNIFARNEDRVQLYLAPEYWEFNFEKDSGVDDIMEWINESEELSPEEQIRIYQNLLKRHEENNYFNNNKKTTSLYELRVKYITPVSYTVLLNYIKKISRELESLLKKIPEAGSFTELKIDVDFKKVEKYPYILLGENFGQITITCVKESENLKKLLTLTLHDSQEWVVTKGNIDINKTNPYVILNVIKFLLDKRALAQKILEFKQKNIFPKINMQYLSSQQLYCMVKIVEFLEKSISLDEKKSTLHVLSELVGAYNSKMQFISNKKRGMTKKQYDFNLTNLHKALQTNVDFYRDFFSSNPALNQLVQGLVVLLNPPLIIITPPPAQNGLVMVA